MKNVVQVLRKTNSRKQVVMFPFGGGSGYSYIGLISEIAADIEVLAVNPPGHLFNEGKALESIDAMVHLYARDLRPFLKENSVLFGHSIGGLVTYELCKILEKETRIKQIIVSSVNPPHCTKEYVDLRSDMETAVLVEKCTVLGGIPEIFKQEPELMEFFINGLRADLKALELYHHPRPAGNIDKIKTHAAVLFAHGDYIVDAGKIKEWELYMNCLEFIGFAGHHFYLFEETEKKAVGQCITRYVNR